MADSRRGAYGLVGGSGWGKLDGADEAPRRMWLKVDAREGLSFCLLREEPFVYVGHFVRGKMRPCVDPDRCLHHAAGIAGQVRVVFSGLDTHRQEAGLLEVNKYTAMQIREKIEDVGFGRGLVIMLRKEGRKTNGQIMLVGTHSILRESDLPEGPDPGEVLRASWAEPERLSL